MLNQNNNESGLASLSKGMDIQEVLAPIQLDEKSSEQYLGTFFPKRAKNKIGIKAEDYSIFATNMIDLSMALNNMYRVLNHIVVRAGQYEDLYESNPEGFQQTMMNRLKTMSESLPEKFSEEITKNFLSGLNSGQYHTIQDSKRYSGGKDILFTGTPQVGDRAAVSSGVTVTISGSEEPLASKPGSYYDSENMRNYASEIAQMAVSVMSEIQELLIGQSMGVANSSDWVQAQVGLDFQFNKLDQVFARKFGFSLDIFRDISFNKILSQNFSILLMIPPHKNAVDAYSSYLNELQYKENNPESQVNPEEPDLAKHVTPESAVLRKFSVSCAINLPKNYVDYISQTSDGSLNLYALTTWLTQWTRLYFKIKGARQAGGGAGKATYRRIPRYVIPASKNSILLKHRDENNLPKDPGRVGEDRIGVNPRGLLTFMPRTEDVGFNNAEAYEKDMEAALEASYRAGAPLTDNQTLASKVFAVNKKDFRVDRAARATKERLGRYKGVLLAFNWDYNIALSAGVSSAFSQIATDLNGSTTPSALSIADYLGYDFAQDRERDQKKTFNSSVAYMLPGTDPVKYDSKTDVPGGVKEDGNTPWLYNSFMKSIMKTYLFLLRKEKVAKIDAIIKEALDELGIDNINEDPLNRVLYGSWLKEDGAIKGDTYNREADLIFSLLQDAASDAIGSPGTNLYKIVSDEVGVENAFTEVKEHNAYFNPRISRMADFGNLYQYVGGLVFKKVCEELTKADPRDLMQPLDEFNSVLQGYSIPFNEISQTIMPMAHMFAKYVPDALNIFEKAEQEAESYEMDDSIDISDIQMPGIAEGSQVFPHQIKAHKSLRRRPKFAVLDIHPGGGKTITLLLDIGALVREVDTLKPLVLCPDKLVANWCEDLAKITKGSWNAIPITGSSFDTWGEEKLEELIQNAPKNTIFFCGINFLKSKAQDISYGPRKLKLYGGTEFIKRQGFNYVALDESHKAKGFNPHSGKISAVHATVKQIFTAPGVEYSRLATGTLIHGVLSDVVGQAAMFSAHIFRTPDDFDIDASANDGAIRVRSKFGQHASVITIKRKEWAFMLPSPIDAFIEVDLQQNMDEGTTIYMSVYNSLLQSTLEDLEAKVKAAKAAGGGASSDDDSDDDAGDEEGGVNEDLDFEDEEDMSLIDPNLFKYYMQRLEQLIIDPWGDDSFVEAAEAAGIDRDFISPKIEEVINRLDRHFTVYSYDKENKTARIVNWEQGMEPRELDVVRYEGANYMRRRMETEEVSASRRVCPPSIVPPTEAPEDWKEEMQGKVLVFCRYTRSVDAIFKALPPKYKSVARRFHGKVDNKWENLESFKTDPDVKILIANEQAIVEGHNLQMASRIVRVETPWSPGDYEQSTARIFRPDPAAAKIENGKPGDMRREVIYIDWLMAKGTMEVAKVSRLMWKTVEKTKFDEKGNPLYDDIMGITLNKIQMNIPTLLEASTTGMEAFMDHFSAKSELNAIESQEFHEMRKTTLAVMQDLPVVEPMSDFKRLDQFPIMPNQNIPDPEGFGLIRFSDWYGQWTDKNYGNDLAQLDGLTQEDLTKLVKGMPVRTEFGTGVIVGFRANWVKRENGTRHLDHKMPVTNLKIRYSGNDEVGSVDPRKVFVASKITQAEFNKFFSTDKPWATDSERKRIERETLKKERAKQKAKEEKEKATKKEKEQLEKEKAIARRAKKRKENLRNNKPVNDGVDKRVGRKLTPVKPNADVVVDKEGEEIKDMRIQVIPSIFNGFLALHVNVTDPDAHDLKSLGFQDFGSYAYAEFKRYMHFEKALDYIDEKFQIDRPSSKRLEAALDAFEDFKRMDFNIRQAAKVQADLPNFFRTRHRESRDRKTIKVYPVVMDDRLRLTVDLRTNPLMKKHMNKTMPGAGQGGKWKLHEGMTIFFAVNKTEAKAKLRELMNEGYTITNMEKVVESIRKLKLVRSKEHNAELKNMTKR